MKVVINSKTMNVVKVFRDEDSTKAREFLYHINRRNHKYWIVYMTVEDFLEYEKEYLTK